MNKSIERLVQYTKIVELNVYKVNILFYFNFVRESFDKAFDGLYKDVVDFKYKHSKRVQVLVGFIFRGIYKRARLSLVLNEEKWEIIKIVDKRRTGRGYEYKVCWEKTQLLESELENTHQISTDFSTPRFTRLLSTFFSY